ncbi:MAG: pantetheine-phosphate adenylyltransferase [Clostridia bacterium]|nr:pantetheine-phosphate adenylyltransferase [Clostridia bacterium]
MKTAIISGTFDPMTVGHVDIVRRAAMLFDKVVVAVSSNSEKNCFFPDEVRLATVNESIKGIENAEAYICDGLLAEFCNRFENPIIVRGARMGSEFDYERTLFIINKNLGVPETIIFPAESGLEHISSTYVRELIKYGKDIKDVVSDGARKVIEEYLNK